MVDDLRCLIDAVESPILRLEREIRARAKPDPRVNALQVLPGVGWLTAMTLVAEIGAISRFPTARKLCSWSGLTPKVRNSDVKVRHERISRNGPASVRFVLGEADRRSVYRHPGRSRPGRRRQPPRGLQARPPLLRPPRLGEPVSSGGGPELP